VGWLDGEHPFETARPAKWMVRRLWSWCECSLLHAGGFHECNIAACPGPARKLIRSDIPSEAELEDTHAALREQIQTGALRKLSKAYKSNFLSNLDQSFKSARRGYHNLVLGIHPDTGERLELGYAEIFVFGKRGKIYSAPNMLYHYVTIHHYKPPEEFIQALKQGPSPPAREYVDRLVASGLPLWYVQGCEAIWQSQKLKRVKARLRRLKRTQTQIL